MTVEIQFYIAKNDIKIVTAAAHRFTVFIGKAFEKKQVGFVCQWKTTNTKVETFPEERRHPETLRARISAIMTDPVMFYQEQVDHVVFITHSETVLTMALQAKASGMDVKVYEIDDEYKLIQNPNYENFFSNRS